MKRNQADICLLHAQIYKLTKATKQQQQQKLTKKKKQKHNVNYLCVCLITIICSYHLFLFLFIFTLYFVFTFKLIQKLPVQYEAVPHRRFADATTVTCVLLSGIMVAEHVNF